MVATIAREKRTYEHTLRDDLKCAMKKYHIRTHKNHEMALR